MDFWDAIGRLVRRWYLTIPLLAAAAAGSLAITGEVESSWRADTQLLFSPSARAGESTVNPLLRGGKATLDSTTQAVVARVESPAFADERSAESPDAAVTFAFDDEAPIVTVEVSAPDPTDAVAVADVAIAQVEEALDDVQREVGAPTLDRVRVVALGDVVAEEQPGDPVRVLVGALAAGTIAVALVVLAFDQLLVRRRERRLASRLEHEVERMVADMADDRPVAATR